MLIATAAACRDGMVAVLLIHGIAVWDGVFQGSQADPAPSKPLSMPWFSAMLARRLDDTSGGVSFLLPGKSGEYVPFRVWLRKAALDSAIRIYIVRQVSGRGTLVSSALRLLRESG